MVSEKMTPVAVVMGSDSDLKVMENCVAQLRDFGVEATVRIISAHRTPEIAADFAQTAQAKGIQVIIGSENKEETLRECSVVVSSYGVPGGATGAIGVIGPTRMPYAHAISAVRYLSSVMSELASKLYG